jgi:hypothetical protein
VRLNLYVGINARFICRYKMMPLGQGKVKQLHTVDTMTGSGSLKHCRILCFADKVYKSLGTFELVRKGTISIVTAIVVIYCGNRNLRCISILRAIMNQAIYVLQNSPSIVPNTVTFDLKRLR